MKTTLKNVKRSFALLLAMLMVCASLPVYVIAEDEATSDFIEIYTIEDLYKVRYDLEANYILMNDIDLTEATAEGGDWDYNGRGWNPIGGGSNYTNGAFSGKFDGNGHKIIGMRIELPSYSTGYPSGMGDIYAGLFAQISGSVYDLTIEGGDISIYGRNSTSYNIYAGAIAGSNNGTIKNIVSNMNSIHITSQNNSDADLYVGGIVGYNDYRGTITCSNNATTITVKNYRINDLYVGGICGYSTTGTISYCFNTGNIAGITNNYNYSHDSSYSNVAGIVGRSCGTSVYSTVKIHNCYNVGNVKVFKSVVDGTDDTSNAEASGIANISGFTQIAYCYNTQPTRYAISNTDVTNCYYLNGSGADCTGATALSDTQMKLKSTYYGFDFDNTWVINSYAVYPYPQLKNNIQDLSEVVELIRMISLPQTTTYYTGEALNLQGAFIEVVYASGKTEIMSITKDMISGYKPNSAKEQTLTVKYKGTTTSFNVTVNQKPATIGIYVSKKPVSTEILVGTPLNLTGAKVDVAYANGTTKTYDITENMISGLDINKVGEQTVTVTVDGCSDSFIVTVIPVQIQSIELKSLPSKINYVEGEVFDTTGMSVTAIFNNGTQMDVKSGFEVSGYTPIPGTHTVTVKYLDFTTEFTVTVVPVKAKSITIKHAPYKVNYFEGEEFDITGLSLTATFNNGTQKDILSGFEVSGYSSMPGTHTITVKYQDATTEFTVNVEAKKVVELTLASQPTKTEYYQGESLDTEGMVVTAKYNNGEVSNVTDYTVTNLDGTTGLKTVTVSYGGQNLVFLVKVLAKVATDLTITTLPTKVVYIEGESADYSGMVVTAEFNSGKSEVVTDYTVVGFTSTPGKHTILVSYEGYVDTFEITVVPKELVDIKIVVPEKLTYFVGEELDLTGMVVMAHYNNGTTAEVGTYEISGFDSKTPGIKTVTVTFGTCSSAFAISVLEKQPIVTNGRFDVSVVDGRLGEKVVVDVSVTGNPGIAGIKHTINFDSDSLKYVSLSIKDEFSNGTVVVNSNKASEGEITVVWFNPSDITEDGTIYSIEFEILETADDGISEVQLSFDENGNGNANGDDLIFEVYNGSVAVKSWWLGDIDGDRIYTMVDLLKIAHYVAGEDMGFTEKQKLSADVNEDGTVNIHDLTLLSQWLLEAEM